MKTCIALSIFICMACTGYSQTLEKNDGTASAQIISETNIKVFPNPATTVVHILGLKNTSKADIAIMDIYGNVVLAHQWEIRRNAINIPISTLSSGAYIITIHSKEQQLHTKFYKQ